MWDGLRISNQSSSALGLYSVFLYIVLYNLVYLHRGAGQQSKPQPSGCPSRGVLPVTNFRGSHGNPGVRLTLFSHLVLFHAFPCTMPSPRCQAGARRPPNTRGAESGESAAGESSARPGGAWCERGHGSGLGSKRSSD